MPVLDVEELHVRIATRNGPLHAVRGVSFSIEHGETFALVGESGCGKSMTALSLLDLMPQNGKREAKRLQLDGVEIGALPEPELRQIRGDRAAMIFQEPMTALNPVLTIGEQLTEGPRLHHPDLSKDAAKRRAIELLERCGISQPELRLAQYPHELSGGMRQRAALVREQLFTDESRKAVEASINFWQNTLCLLVQLFLTSRALLLLGISAVLCVMPSVSLLGLGDRKSTRLNSSH